VEEERKEIRERLPKLTVICRPTEDGSDFYRCDVYKDNQFVETKILPKDKVKDLTE